MELDVENIQFMVVGTVYATGRLKVNINVKIIKVVISNSYVTH